MNARYGDRHGEVVTELFNDGKILSMRIRDVEFRGTDFDSLEPVANTNPSQLTAFSLDRGSLCACTIEAQMPLPVVMNGEKTDSLLSVRLELGHVEPNGQLDRLDLELALTLQSSVYHSRGTSGWFEDELLDIQRQLPENVHIMACINCAFSDYSPFGHGMFGSLACFRDNKSGYLAVKSKHDLFRVWNTMTEFVQETYLCPEFQRRTRGVGYRG